jgi:DNA recombination protein Rad52
MTPEMTTLLAAPLNGTRVSKRKQGNFSLSYIEAWWAISEANRIFGFDGWVRETFKLSMVAEQERKIKDAQGWGVTYVAQVRVTVGDIVREGTGAGHGIDRNLGLAHESAVKEAESDAMKRAMMTFGNPFGLALYDKAQEGVNKGGDWNGPLAKTKLVEALRGLMNDVNAADDLDSLGIVIDQNKAIIDQCKADLPLWWDGLTDGGAQNLMDRISTKERQLNGEIV